MAPDAEQPSGHEGATSPKSARSRVGRIDDPIWNEPAGPATAPNTSRVDTHRLLALLLALVVFAALWIGLTIVTAATVLQTYTVAGSSMSPTLGPGERVAVVLIGTPGRDDIVIQRAPPQATVPPGSGLIKRVVATGGDTVSCCADGHLVVNGRAVREAYAAPTQPKIGRVEVPAGDLYLLGDNRLDSQDSRFWGPVPTTLVTGTVVARGSTATALSPVVIGCILALLCTLGVWFFWIRRTSVWRRQSTGASHTGSV